MEELKIKNLADIEKFEKIPIEQRFPYLNTYDILKHGAAINPEATALSFFLSGENYANPSQVNYRDFLSNINKTANLFHDLGVGPKDVITYLLPNLPQTHYILWGGRGCRDRQSHKSHAGSLHHP